VPPKTRPRHRLAAAPLLVLLASALTAPALAHHFGVLFWHASPNDEAALRGIEKALAEIGRTDELTIVHADSDPERGRAELRRLRDEGVDLVFALGTEAALLARDEINDLPVVFTAVTNPVESGVVPDWSGSRSNLAGNSNWIDSPTVLRVFQKAVPGLHKLGILRSTQSGVVSAAELRAMSEYLAEDGAPSVSLVERIIDDVAEIPSAIQGLLDEEVQAVWIPIDFLIYQNLDAVRTAVGDKGLPLVSSSLRGAEAGAVAGILVDYELLGKRALEIALRITEGGEEPGNIPVGTMRGYMVVVNLTAAERCGYELPLSLLALADRILQEPAIGGNADGR
jgi:putative ABC transport system substrate-binding protein